MEFSQVISTTFGKVTYGTAGKPSLDDLKEIYPVYPKTPEGWIGYTKDWAKGEWNDPSHQIVTLNQVHGDTIHSIPSDLETKDSLPLFAGDGLYTESPNTLLVVRTADCVPVFLYSNKRPFVAVVHSGWKGTSLGIAERLLDEVVSNGYDLAELQMEIGPYIQGGDYEVGEDVAAHFLSLGETVCFPKGNGKFLLDVGLAIEVRVRERFRNLSEIKNSHINVFQSPLYFSHRAKEEGRNLNFILWES
ncbi:polyphenol oxidase family protein [Leptospira vanthielii]|uniref:YfiH family protein n=1 Tax=Leptospira vanthielii serovar Holland str. Waz Holland = ATCC 700522 TaxID=1218591 RepID=N1WEW4_9LEPT|nr:polyphenol oxidase family protein [Leptospira vanthielii]EMY70416.1 YfiH family protein [Leptospira vanthielii serovar Holland str. Waz Holland = ATCC 700522]